MSENIFEEDMKRLRSNPQAVAVIGEFKGNLQQILEPSPAEEVAFQEAIKNGAGLGEMLQMKVAQASTQDRKEKIRLLEEEFKARLLNIPDLPQDLRARLSGTDATPPAIGYSGMYFLNIRDGATYLTPSEQEQCAIARAAEGKPFEEKATTIKVYIASSVAEQKAIADKLGYQTRLRVNPQDLDENHCLKYTGKDAQGHEISAIIVPSSYVQKYREKLQVAAGKYMRRNGLSEADLQFTPPAVAPAPIEKKPLQMDASMPQPPVGSEMDIGKMDGVAYSPSDAIGYGALPFIKPTGRSATV